MILWTIAQRTNLLDIFQQLFFQILSSISTVIVSTPKNLTQLKTDGAPGPEIKESIISAQDIMQIYTIWKNFKNQIISSM